MKLELSPDDLAGIARDLVPHLRDVLGGADAPSPWMTTAEAIEYTRVRPGTFTKLAAEGRIPSHGTPKSKLYFRPEVDAALLRGYRAADTTKNGD